MPKHLDDNDVIPPAGKIPSLISSLRYPRRRAISIGPQSMADAYETIELIRRKRQNSASSAQTSSKASLEAEVRPKGIRTGHATILHEPNEDHENHDLEGHPETSPYPLHDLLKKQGSSLSQTENSTNAITINGEYRKVFSQLEEPRVRYDVEVITKIIIYSGVLIKKDFILTID